MSLFFFTNNPAFVIFFGLLMLVLAIIIVYAVIKGFETTTRKTNPLIASEIPSWSTYPMVYDYIEDID